MSANPDQLQVIILSKNANNFTQTLKIHDNEIETTKFAMLIGLKMDYQIIFNEHISTLCFKAAMQLNGL